MQNNSLKKWMESSYFSGNNGAYIEEIYESFLNDPNNISDEWKQVFQSLPQTEISQEVNHSKIRDYFRSLAKETTNPYSVVKDPDKQAKEVRVLQLINSFRLYGHKEAKLDPLNLKEIDKVPELSLYHHDLADALDETFDVGSVLGLSKDKLKLRDIYSALKQIYCESIGAEYMHINNIEEKKWIQKNLELSLGTSNFTQDEKINFLYDLTAAEGMEKYLGAKFPGSKRFSLEGGDSLIPMIKEIIRFSGTKGVKEVVIGMAHRGRLNMLVNVIGKKTQDLFDEFSGKHGDTWGTGDVKYHQGFSADFHTPSGNIHLALAFNPSHLEIVNPVVMGSARAREERYGDLLGEKVLPITIHGDSAIAGQGVVAETFNMSQTRGYKVGGTIRIVVNNQVGFTTSRPEDTRSTPYCTDIAKMVQAPIFHVNADDPEAVAFVSRLAVNYRDKFNRDVVIDLVCYRRHGHNESDEPSATQPLMYKIIKKHATTRQLYAEKLLKNNTIEQFVPTSLVNEYRDLLDKGECVVKEWRPMNNQNSNWSKYLSHEWDEEWDSHLDIKKLKELAKKVNSYPDSIKLHNRVLKLYNIRQKMIEENMPLDWGMAETLAYATLVNDKYQIRITGQDSGRGTFFHRHAVIHDQDSNKEYIPLQHINDNQGKFYIYDSVLSEEAVLAFEYGYATAEPNGLTIWEAQFGDFANGAQVVIDQFISSGEQKWGRMCGLTMLLPHGYEGQGPEHSSARLERFLQLCAEQNIQVVVPSTPAQIYHVLRRQVIRTMRRPLVIMSPKSLLRHPQCISSIDELSNGSFESAIGEVDEKILAANVEKIILCSGKVYYDLIDKREKTKNHKVAIIRIEQLYPFPYKKLLEILQEYKHVNNYVWCQEEPQNQGAWYSSQHNFRSVIPEKAELSYAGRPASASPAVGYLSVHLKQQEALVEDALNLS